MKALCLRLLLQHDLSAGDGDRLSCFIFLFDGVKDRLCHVRGETTAVHRDFRLVETFDVFNGSGAGNLAAVQILDEKPSFGIAPERPVEEIAGAYAVDLDAVRDQFHGEALRESDSAEFAAGIRSVFIAALKPALGVDLNDVEPVAAVRRFRRHDGGNHV